MAIPRKDAVGIGLVAITGMLALLHNVLPGRAPAEREFSVADAAPVRDAPQGAPPTVFFDFNLLAADYGEALPHQVVVVRGPVVERVGAVGAVTVPLGAHRIEGNGSAFLVPAPRSPLGMIEPGEHADLLLLKSDPRVSREAIQHPAGLMLRGEWRDPSETGALLVEAGEDR